MVAPYKDPTDRIINLLSLIAGIPMQPYSDPTNRIIELLEQIASGGTVVGGILRDGSVPFDAGAIQDWTASAGNTLRLQSGHIQVVSGATQTLIDAAGVQVSNGAQNVELRAGGSVYQNIPITGAHNHVIGGVKNVAWTPDLNNYLEVFIDGVIRKIPLANP